jgi:CRISPR-associated protein (TIGR03985 family)
LSMAVRLWVILRSLYGSEEDPIYVNIEATFNYSDWRQKFFQDFQSEHSQDKIFSVHHPLCPCAKTIKEWLFTSDSGIEEEQWRASLIQNYFLSEAEIDRLLDPVEWVFDPNAGISESVWRGSFYQRYPLPQQKIDKLLRQVKYPERERHKNRPFAVSRKTLQKDFKILVELGWLKISDERYIKKQELPILNIGDRYTNDFELSQFLNPELAEIVNNFSQRINNTPRFFLHVDYVVSNDARDRIGSWQEQLKQIWEKNPVPPVQIIYDSASLWKEAKRIVYPVCIYYYQRAPYLCAFGETPKSRDEIKWYNYRLDRILKLTELSWKDPEIPSSLKQICLGAKPPSTDFIQEQLASALGFDFYKEKSLMLLRFDTDFHDRYIQGTIRHDTFKQIDLTRATELVKKNAQTETQRRQLLSVLSRYREDPYYQLYYRVEDNDVVMRLRAWGSYVEVLLPWQLREKMSKDLCQAWRTYSNPI